MPTGHYAPDPGPRGVSELRAGERVSEPVSLLPGNPTVRKGRPEGRAAGGETRGPGGAPCSEGHTPARSSDMCGACRERAGLCCFC